MNFGKALEKAKHGEKIARAGWNGKGMYLVFVYGSKIQKEYVRNQPAIQIAKTQDEVEILPHLDMKTADNKVLVGWTPNVIDMLAEDWMSFKEITK